MRSRFYGRALEYFKYSLEPRLTKIPPKGCSVSDIFIWRNDEDWKTYFDLMNVAFLIQPFKSHRSRAILRFYNSQGDEIHKHLHEFNESPLDFLDLSQILRGIAFTFGTFTVSHLFALSDIELGDAFIAERGYVSYLYKNSNIRGYVHGNLDAIAYDKKGKPKFLMGTSLYNRSFNLQYEFDHENTYQIALVNPSKLNQKIAVNQVDVMGNVFCKLVVNVNPLGVGMVNLNPIALYSERYRVIIKSRLAMARPVVIRYSNGMMDIFHG